MCVCVCVCVWVCVRIDSSSSFRGLKANIISCWG